ncbi:MAG TPA: peptidylprolyl isomerase, partial [Sedimenticola sp.]|nr:peptidylprolyl isomerase [Sedimenticola sp.]
SHILISPSERSDAEAKALAERLAAELRKHPDRFASLVKRYSDDPGSRGKKGSLGWVSKKNLVEPFAKAAFALTRVGELSPVIKTRFGYHIIRLDGLPKGKTLSFDEVKAGIYPKVEEEYRRLKRMQYLDNLRASSQRTIDRGAIRDLQSRLD